MYCINIIIHIYISLHNSVCVALVTILVFDTQKNKTYLKMVYKFDHFKLPRKTCITSGLKYSVCTGEQGT